MPVRKPVALGRRRCHRFHRGEFARGGVELSQHVKRKRRAEAAVGGLVAVRIAPHQAQILGAREIPLGVVLIGSPDIEHRSGREAACGERFQQPGERHARGFRIAGPPLQVPEAVERVRSLIAARRIPEIAVQREHLSFGVGPRRARLEP